MFYSLCTPLLLADVAVVGIGGLGHMATKFLNSCGCEVTAMSSNPE